MYKSIQKQAGVHGELALFKKPGIQEFKSDFRNNFNQQTPTVNSTPFDLRALPGKPNTPEIPSNNTQAILKHDFNKISVYPDTSLRLQAKLTINKPGDLYEDEADHVADQVMRMSKTDQEQPCGCGGSCSKCQSLHSDNMHEHLQSKHIGSTYFKGETAPESVHKVLSSQDGKPLDTNTRSFMEARFGHNFTNVRVHSGTAAEKSAKDISSRAYTVGNDIVFGAGQFAPGTYDGRRLIAHELTHVLQQSGKGRTTNGNTERPGMSSNISSQSTPGIARKPEDQPAEASAKHNLGDVALESVIRTLTAQLPGGGFSGKLMSAAMYGFIVQMVNEFSGENSNRFKKALAELIIPANAANFISGYTGGVVAGLISPITDLLGLGVMVEKMFMIASNLTKNAWDKKGELAAEARAIGGSLDQLKRDARERFIALSKNPAEIFTILDALEERAISAAGTAGGSAAKQVVDYFSGKDEDPKEGEQATPQESLKDVFLNTRPEELAGITSLVTSKFSRSRKAIFKTPWQKIGYNIGYALGAILVNVLLLAATEGIGNLIVEVSAGLGKIAPFLAGVEKALVGLGTTIAEIERGIATALGVLLKPVSKAGKWLEPLFKPISEVLNRLGIFVRKLLGLPEKALVAVGARAGVHLAEQAGEKVGEKALPKAATLAEQKAPAVKAAAPAPAVKKVSPPATKVHAPTETPKAASTPGSAVSNAADEAATHSAVKTPKANSLTPVEGNPRIVGEPGKRHVPVGEGHEIWEVREGNFIGCELRSPPPYIKVPCPPGMGTKGKEDIESMTRRGAARKDLVGPQSTAESVEDLERVGGATNAQEAATIGTEVERMELQDWAADLSREGYETFPRNRFGEATVGDRRVSSFFTDQRARPDMVAINEAKKTIIVGDVTGNPATRANIPGQIGQAEGLHIEKTIEYARQLKRQLPHGADYKVFAQDRHWQTGSKTKLIEIP